MLGGPGGSFERVSGGHREHSSKTAAGVPGDSLPMMIPRRAPSRHRRRLIALSVLVAVVGGLSANAAVVAQQDAEATGTAVLPLDGGDNPPGVTVPQSFVDDVRGMTYHAFTATSRASDDYLRQRPLPERLAPLGKPLLVIFGSEDHRWRASSAADYRTVPGATVALVPGVGHSPILEDPPRTVASLLPLVAAHAVTGQEPR
jgi:pimeloyl-ACP methyl ester carboxylesterase